MGYRGNGKLLERSGPLSATFIGFGLRAGSGIVKIDTLHFLAGCCTRQLNHALSVLSLSLGFLSVSVMLLAMATFYIVLIVCSVFWLFLLGCYYQCKRLTGTTRLRNDL